MSGSGLEERKGISDSLLLRKQDSIREERREAQSIKQLPTSEEPNPAKNGHDALAWCLPQIPPFSTRYRIRFTRWKGTYYSLSTQSSLSLKLHLTEFCLQKLFTEALGGATMEGFFKLISYYQTQSEPAFCGLGTLAMVLNALAIDPGRKWKGLFISISLILIQKRMVILHSSFVTSYVLLGQIH